jgi:hypothetical protein
VVPALGFTVTVAFADADVLPFEQVTE